MILLFFGPTGGGAGAAVGPCVVRSHAAIVVPLPSGAPVAATGTRFPAMGSVDVVDVLDVLVLVVVMTVVVVVVVEVVVEIVVVEEVVVVLVLVVVVAAVPRETQTLPLPPKDTHIFVWGFNAYDITPEPMSDTLFEILVKRR